MENTLKIEKIENFLLSFLFFFHVVFFSLSYAFLHAETKVLWQIRKFPLSNNNNRKKQFASLCLTIFYVFFCKAFLTFLMSQINFAETFRENLKIFPRFFV